jgi:UDP-2-acetamido-3-amino-2,3-dideoxy-glucuronate N-acetyltransferase
MVHELAEVKTSKVGANTSIWQFVVVLEGAVIGDNTNINCHCFIENDVIVGNNVTIKSGVYLWDGIHLEDNVFIGPNTTFVNDLLPRSKQRPEKFEKTLIRKGASVGANSTILSGIEIGTYAMIGAGSVVTGNVPPYTLWYGNPARFKAYICECGTKLSPDLRCEGCGKNFRLYNDNIELVK